MKDYLNQKFGRLTLISEADSITYKSGTTHRYFNVKCECGNTKKVNLYNLTSGKILSCGCYSKELNTTHGMWGTREYQSWEDMKSRVARNKYYKNIKICKRWRNSFQAFYDDMGKCPEGFTLDRIRNDKGYKKKNCRWASRTMQSRNTRLIRSSNTSGYRGVSFHKQRGRWRAYIQVNKVMKHLGMFDTAVEAAEAYNQEARKYEGYPLN